MKSSSSFTDEHLMRLLAEGNNDALAELVHRYQGDVYRFCYHYVRNAETAKELAQETFIRVFKARDRFDSERDFKPWLFRIARNLSFNDLKRRNNVSMESLEELVSTNHKAHLLVSDIAQPDQQGEAQERRVALAKMLDSLSVDSRELLVMRFFERMSAKEMADVLESTEGAVRTRLHRVLKQLHTNFQSWRHHL